MRLTINDYYNDDKDDDNDEDEDYDDNGDDDGDNNDGGGGNGGINEDNYDNDDDHDKDRLFTCLYFSVIWSRSRALRYGLPSCMSVKTIWKSRCTPLMIRRAMSRRSHVKIRDCEQSMTKTMMIMMMITMMSLLKIIIN